MKKLIQVSIIVVLVFTLFQVVSGTSMVFAGTMCSTAGQSTCLPAMTSASNVQVAVCLSGRVCVTPNVGWNS